MFPHCPMWAAKPPLTSSYSEVRRPSGEWATLTMWVSWWGFLSHRGDLVKCSQLSKKSLGRINQMKEKSAHFGPCNQFLIENASITATNGAWMSLKMITPHSGSFVLGEKKLKNSVQEWLIFKAQRRLLTRKGLTVRSKSSSLIWEKEENIC